MSQTKQTIGEIRDKIKGFVPVMEGLSRARNPFELRHFVIGKHDDRIQQYKQAVIEMEAKYKAIQEALHAKAVRELDRREKMLEIIENPKGPKDEIANARIQLELAKFDREDHEAGILMTGAFKEVMDFIHIIETDYSDLIDKTEEELLKSEPDYWGKRLAKQIHLDMVCNNGRISEGNRNVLESLPREFQERVLAASMIRTEEHTRIEDAVAKKVKVLLAESYPHKTTYIAPPEGVHIPLKFRKDAPDGYPENRIVNVDRAEIMIATLHRPGDDEWISSSFFIPGGKNYITTWLECPNAEMIGEYRNRIVMDALSLGCEHLFFVDDDLLVESDALQKLYAHKLDVVGGWYTKKEPVPESATLIKTPNGSAMPVPKDATGLIEIDWVLTGGLTLINMDVFKRFQYPWYYTGYQSTEDTYFAARLREAGIKQWLDTSIKAIHVDKATRTGYGFDGIKKLT